MACSLCVRRRCSVHWMTGPADVIGPLLTPWLGFEGDGCFDYFSTIGTPGPFLSRWSSFPLLFHLDVPFLTPLGVDKEAPSFLRTAANAFTKALCLTDSISAKGKKQMLDKLTKIRTTERKKLRKRNLHRQEYVFNLRATGVGTGPLQ